MRAPIDGPVRWWMRWSPKKKNIPPQIGTRTAADFSLYMLRKSRDAAIAIELAETNWLCVKSGGISARVSDTPIIGQ